MAKEEVKEKVKAVYNNDLVSLEILKVKKTMHTPEEAEEYYNDRVKTKYYVIDDLDENYIIRLSYTEKKKELKSVDPITFRKLTNTNSVNLFKISYVKIYSRLLSLISRKDRNQSKRKEILMFKIKDSRFRKDTKELIDKVRPYILDPEDTAIIAIGRGGLVPAQYMAYGLGVRNIYTIQSRLYKEKKKEIQEIEGTYSIPFDRYRTFIVVDDIYDSGETLHGVIETLEDTLELFNEASPDKAESIFIPAVVYTQKEKKCDRRGIIFGSKVPRNKKGKKQWVQFPWDDLGGMG
jgi:xanthine phosphoribosyltransferase